MKETLFIILLLLIIEAISAQIILPSYQGVHNTTEMECPETVTDIEGNTYDVVKIGNQCWMAQNMRYLPSVVDHNTGSYTTPYYYVYGYNGNNVSEAKATVYYDIYGVLYNWPAAMNGSASSSSNPSGVQGVCPTGWHLPSVAEWTQLTNFLGGVVSAGGKLKETGTEHWNSPNTGATNETGFTARPGSYRNNIGATFDPGVYGYWWTSTENSTENSWYKSMSFNSTTVSGYHSIKELGRYIRCIKD